MTRFLANVDGEQVSLPSFKLSSIFARVNEQQVSSTIFFTVLLTSGIRGMRTMRITEWNGLSLSKTCQVELPSHLREQFSYDNFSKTRILVLKKSLYGLI